jgi:putative methionine-R-sulfoxide reductase with GAF domain
VARDLTDRIRNLVGADSPRVERARRVADTVRAVTGHRWVGVYAVEDDEVVNLAWSGPGPPAHPRFAFGSGLTGAAIEARATIVSNDVATDSRYLRTLDTTGSEIIVPVIADDRVVGTLDVESARTGAFGEQDRRMLERIAAELLPLYRGRRAPAD